MNRTKILILLTLAFAPYFTHAQIKPEFEKALEEDRQRDKFITQLLTLDKLFKNGIDSSIVDSLKATGEYDFLERKLSTDNKIVVIINVVPNLYETYLKLEREGKINVLKSLRAAGRLKVPGRTVANEVELPKKTNKNQSYNDFYLDVIRQLMVKYKALLLPDQLDFPTYQSWEKEAALTSELSIRQYRESFILFLYKHYKIT